MSDDAYGGTKSEPGGLDQLRAVADHRLPSGSEDYPDHTDACNRNAELCEKVGAIAFCKCDETVNP